MVFKKEVYRRIELRYKTVVPYRCRCLASFGRRRGDNFEAKVSRRRRIGTKELEQGYTDPPTRKRCSRTTERRYRDNSGRYPAGSSRDVIDPGTAPCSYMLFSPSTIVLSPANFGEKRAAPSSRGGSAAFSNRGHLLSLPPIPARYARPSFFVTRSSSSPDISRNIVKPFAKPTTYYFFTFPRRTNNFLREHRTLQEGHAFFAKRNYFFTLLFLDVRR